METTVGQLILNDALPEDLRDYVRVWDRKSTKAVMTALAEKYPDRYAEVAQKLQELAARVVTTYGGAASLTLDSLKTPPEAAKAREELKLKIDKTLAGKGGRAEKNRKVLNLIADRMDEMTALNYKAALKENNPLAVQVASGSRGNPSQFQSLTFGDMIFTDHKDRPIPIAILKSFSEGLDPVEYWAGAYGARKGSVSVKFATPKAGFLGKQLAMATHRLLVTEKDCGTDNGILVDRDDADNEGSVLARGYGGLAAGSVLTPKTIGGIKNDKILVRSSLTCQAINGVCQRCAGVREKGGFPSLGDNIGMTAAQAIAEPIGQGVLGVKHTSSKIRRDETTKTGIDLVNQLVQVPRTFAGGATISDVDGRVEQVENAPQGGLYVAIGGSRHWVPPESELTVKKGDMVEAGDVITTGIPNPAQVTRHKGIGEGRRYFADLFRRTLAENKFPAHRRNVELLARGLINHVRVTDLDGPDDTLPDDVVEYDSLVRGYRPRYGTKALSPKDSIGLHLERPVLHFSIGTRITPRAAKTLKEQGIDRIPVHPDPPSFVPEMTRAMEALSHSDDWMVRLGGFQLKKSLTESVHRGRSSAEHGTSYIPPLAKGIEFGQVAAGKGY